MEHWSWWAGGLALAGVAIFHQLVLNRLMAVSGRMSALIDRLRHGPQQSVEMSEAEMMEALRRATAEQFGQVVEDDSSDSQKDSSRPAAPTPQPSPLVHVLFLSGLVVGGLSSVALAGDVTVVPLLEGERFLALLGDGPGAIAVLVLGGVLVGFGTRMAQGCTSGHGLCGVSRLQLGSLLATAAFFGAGIVTSLLLGALA